MIDLLKQKKTWFRLCVALLVLPAGCWFLLLMIGFLIPKSEEKTGLQIPRATPREGYEIIYPETHSGRPFLDRFYYLNNKRQVIYRYDENRYLELQGEDCQGLIWYHNDELDIHTRIDDYFFTHERMPLQYQYFNPGKQFIGIPTGNLSTVMVSLDYGKTFFATRVSSYAAMSGEEVERFIGLDRAPLRLKIRYSSSKAISQFTKRIRSDFFSSEVEDDTDMTILPGLSGFFVLKNKDILFGDELNYGYKYVQSTYFSLKGALQRNEPHDYADLFHIPLYRTYIESVRDIPTEPYEGWDRIRCEVGAER